MATTVDLPADLERFARYCVASGRFESVAEVLRSGLRMLQDAELRRAAFVASLERAEAEGVRDGFASAAEVEAEMRSVITEAAQAPR